MTKENIVSRSHEWKAGESRITLQEFLTQSEGYRVVLRGDFGYNHVHSIGGGSFKVETPYGAVTLSYSGENAFGSGNMAGRVTSATREPLWVNDMVVVTGDGGIWVRLDNGFFANSVSESDRNEFTWEELADLTDLPVQTLISKDGARNLLFLSSPIPDIPYSDDDYYPEWN